MKKFVNTLEGTDCGDAELPVQSRDIAKAKTVLRVVSKTPDIESMARRTTALPGCLLCSGYPGISGPGASRTEQAQFMSTRRSLGGYSGLPQGFGRKLVPLMTPATFFAAPPITPVPEPGRPMAVPLIPMPVPLITALGIVPLDATGPIPRWPFVPVALE